MGKEGDDLPENEKRPCLGGRRYERAVQAYCPHASWLRSGREVNDCCVSCEEDGRRNEEHKTLGQSVYITNKWVILLCVDVMAREEEECVL